MRDPHHGRQQPPGYLSHSQVLDLLNKGLRENPNAEILDLRGKPNWLDSKIVSNNPNALTKAGWAALSKIISFPCIDTPRELLRITKVFLASGSKEPISAESLTGIEGIIADIAYNHRDIGFRELCALCSFVLHLGRHDYTEGHRGITAVRHRLDSPGPEAETLQAVLGVAVAYLNVPEGTPLSHAESFRRRMRTALQTGDEVSPTNAALFYLETSELPEEQRAVFRQTWARVACQFDELPGVLQQVAGCIRELKKINEHFQTLSGTQSTPEVVAGAISGQFRNARNVSNIFVPQQVHLRLSGPDSDVALTKLSQGVEPEQLQNLIEFSRRLQIPLKDVPDVVSIVPAEVQQLLLKVSAPHTSSSAHSASMTGRSVAEF